MKKMYITKTTPLGVDFYDLVEYDSETSTTVLILSGKLEDVERSLARIQSWREPDDKEQAE